MSRKTTVLRIENPHLTIRLYESLLKVDLKGSLKHEIEEALENKPILKETIGAVLSVFVPLHIRLTDVDSVHAEETGKVRITLPRHRDIVLQLDRKDAEIFVRKIKERIFEAKKRRMKLERIERKRAREHHRRSVSPSSYGTVPYYFPTEQVDIVNKFKRRKGRKK